MGSLTEKLFKHLEISKLGELTRIDCKMWDQIGFIVKIIVISLILSLIIKYGGQWLNPEPTRIAALVGVLAPTVVLGLWLGVQGQSAPKG